MTIKEIRIISKKRQELSEKVNPISLIKFIATKEVSKEDLENKESIRSQIESIESIGRMQLLDELMKEMGYEWNSSEKHYIGKLEKNKSYADAWDEVTGKKEGSEEDDENCEECVMADICPIRKTKEDEESVTSSDEKTERTIIHKIEVKDEKILKDLKDNPDLTIYVKDGTLSMRGHVKTGAFLSVICEMLNTISSSNKRNVKEFVDMWNYGTEDKELHLAMKKEAD